MEQNSFVILRRVCKFFFPRCYVVCIFTIMFTFILNTKESYCSIIVSDFSKIKQDSNLVTSFPVKSSRSLLECSRYCSSTQNCCGFNYKKLNKMCLCLYSDDFVNPNFLQEDDVDVYLHKKCDHLTEVCIVIKVVLCIIFIA